MRVIYEVEGDGDRTIRAEVDSEGNVEINVQSNYWHHSDFELRLSTKEAEDMARVLQKASE